MTENYYLKQLDTLAGGKVIAPVITKYNPNDPVQFLGLEIEMPDKTVRLLWFLRDEEGNGPGSFQIDDYSKPKKPQELNPEKLR